MKFIIVDMVSWNKLTLKIIFNDIGSTENFMINVLFYRLCFCGFRVKLKTSTASGKKKKTIVSRVRVKVTSREQKKKKTET